MTDKTSSNPAGRLGCPFGMLMLFAEFNRELEFSGNAAEILGHWPAEWQLHGR
jgi:hypothetical protein